MADGVKRAAAEVIPALQKASGEAVGASMTNPPYRTSVEAAKALGEAAKPVLGSLSGVVQAAGDAEGSLKRAGQWFAWKWVAVAAGGLVGVCLVAYASLVWQLHQVKSLDEEKAALAADIKQMRVNAAALEKRGARIKLSQCGGRLCIEASTNQGKGLTDWRGPWKTTDQGTPLVIPRGY